MSVVTNCVTKYSPNKENRFAEDDMSEYATVKDNGTLSGRYNFLKDYYFWIFLSIAIVFGILVWFMLRSKLNTASVNGTTLLSTLTNPSVLVILTIIGLIVVAYAAYQASAAHGDGMLRLVGNLFFIGFLLLFLLWAYLLSVSGFEKQAFWVSVILVIVAVLWMIWLWKIDRLSAYVMIYVVVLFILLSFYTKHITK